jgi:hypothetical protein
MYSENTVISQPNPWSYALKFPDVGVICRSEIDHLKCAEGYSDKYRLCVTLNMTFVVIVKNIFQIIKCLGQKVFIPSTN